MNSYKLLKEKYELLKAENKRLINQIIDLNAKIKFQEYLINELKKS